MQAPRRVDIRKQTRLFDDFFKIDEVIVSHEQYNGTMSADQRRLIFERGDLVAVLLLDLDLKSVVLTEQFKVPSLVGRRRDDPSTTNGWITEAVAGMVELDELPEAAVIRETMEETGYQIHNPRLIAKFFSSPGGVSERIFLYFAKVRGSDKLGADGGVGDEDVRSVWMTLEDLFDLLDSGSMDDPKLLIGAYWLQNHLRSLQDRERLIAGP